MEVKEEEAREEGMKVITRHMKLEPIVVLLLQTALLGNKVDRLATVGPHRLRGVVIQVIGIALGAAGKGAVAQPHLALHSLGFERAARAGQLQYHLSGAIGGLRNPCVVPGPRIGGLELHRALLK